ncbi:MAG: helix-turn-helix transcriptional regulator [Lachnospiraceae bacterium]|nr:helix-turn-helix transcriptional regulator [Lachnospiraceae bacterium]
MDTVDRIFELVKESGLSNQAVEKAAGLSNGSFSKWKKREYLPSADYILKLARYFNVSADYLFCLSDVKEVQQLGISLTPEEELLLNAYRTATAQGRFRIIQVCMNEMDSAGKGATVSAG